MVRRGAILALALLVAAASPARAASQLAEQAFREGNERYLKGDYAGAVSRYESAAQAAPRDAALLYNLGNAYLKSGDTARAIAAYERSLLYEPRDKDAAWNLGYAKGLLARRYGGDILKQNEQIAAAFDTALARTTRGELTALFLALYAPFSALLVFRAIRRSPAAARAAALFGALSLVAGGVLAFHVAAYDRAPRGVLVGGTVAIKSGPDEGYETTFTVHEGLLVRVEETRPGWSRVKLANGLVGWIPEASLAWVSRGA